MAYVHKEYDPTTSSHGEHGRKKLHSLLATLTATTPPPPPPPRGDRALPSQKKCLESEDAEAVKRAIADYHQDEDGTGGGWEGLEEGLEDADEEENEEEAAAAFAAMMQQASEVFHLLAHIDESAGTFSFTRQDLVSDRGHDFHLVPLTP
jgi:hypothetical protein